MEWVGGTRHGARRTVWASRSSGRKEEATGWAWKSVNGWMYGCMCRLDSTYWDWEHDNNIACRELLAYN